MPLDHRSRPRRNDQVIAQTFEEEVVLLDPRSGEHYALAGVGARIWALCDGTRTVGEVIAAIEQEYDAPPATIAADVLDLLGELIDERLVLD